MSYDINCDFTNPVNANGDPAKLDQSWSFKSVNCIVNSPTSTLDKTLELIQNTDTGARFYVNKQVSYGDFLILTFLTIFLVLGITKFAIDFMIPKRINFKR